jgi:hypothetical protein
LPVHLPAFIETNVKTILNCDGKWSFTCARKNIDLVKIGLPEHFQINKKSVDSLIETVRQIRYCKGVENNNADLPCFKEHASLVGEENFSQVRFRFPKCMQILPFKSSNTASSSCNYCKIQKYYI